MMRYLQACMEIIHRQEYISWKLPKGWTILLTSNPSNGNYMVNEMDPAHKTRYISVGLKFNAEEWAKWAEFNDMDSRCINFILLHQELLEPKEGEDQVNPRTVSMFFDLISGIKDFGSVEGLTRIQTLGEAAVGLAFTSTFTMFINNRLDKLPSPKYIMEEGIKEVKETLEAVMNQDGNYRSDISSTLGMRIINYSLRYADKNPIKPEYIDRLEALLISNKIFTEDISFNALKLIYAGNRNKFKGMLMKPSLNKIIVQ